MTINSFYCLFISISFWEDPKQVKWELEGANFFYWEIRIPCNGTGIHQQKNKIGLNFEQDSHWEKGIW